MSAYEINSWFGREICNHRAKMRTAQRKHSMGKRSLRKHNIWKHSKQRDRVLHWVGLPRKAIILPCRKPEVRSILGRSTLLEAQCSRVIKRLQETGPSTSVDPIEYLPSANTHCSMFFLPIYIKSPLHAAVVIYVRCNKLLHTPICCPACGTSYGI